MKLLSNQSEAISKQIENKVGALFMKMGTGKTRVALELVNLTNGIDLILWIGPLRSLDNVKLEIDKWGGFKCNNVVLVGIETIQSSDKSYLSVYKALQNAENPYIVVDESIKIKNHEAKRTKRLLEFSKMAEYKLILNGEPITNNLLDLWSQFEFLNPMILRMKSDEFKNTFCKYTTITKRQCGKQYSKEFITGYENIDYLYSLIGEYVYECDLDLSVKKIFEVEKYSLSKDEKQRYNELKEKYLDNEMLIAMNNNIFIEMTQKIQNEYCCSEEKVKICKKWITDQSKTIIFCKFIKSMELCREIFPEALVLNYKTGSMSLNLQDRPYTVYFDQTFDWGDVIQSQHRNYRTGQSVDCRYLQLIGDVGLEDLMKENNKKKILISEYIKKISNEKSI